MIPYPSIDPEIFRVGPFAVRWYGMMYLLGFAASYGLVAYQVRAKKIPLTREFLDSFFTVLILGLILGARLGYALFYNADYYGKHPLELFALWQGGMSFHGGFIGSVSAGWWWCRRHGVDAWLVADLVAATAPVGIGLGRLGNFINGELYGKRTDVPWAMIFPDGGPFPRHPSQLYEFVLEGVLLFGILWYMKDNVRKTGMLVALFIFCYGMFRFGVEFVREPDAHLGYVAGPFTMGQVLSAAMMVAGLILLVLRGRRRV
jgi:phosphatidylglycerol:prolipoprotein diacylglycerol transferase